VTIPLAREGFEVVGLDFSEHVLALARAKLNRESAEVRNRVTLVPGDMRDFELGRTFAAVFVPNASVFHLPEESDLSQCLACLYRHARPGGLAVVDVVSPHRMANQEVGRLAPVREGLNPATGLPTRELNRKLRIERDVQTVRVEHIYLEGEGASQRTYRFEQDYRWVEQEEGVRLLEDTGFAAIEAFGDYDRQPFTEEASRLILVGRRPQERTP